MGCVGLRVGCVGLRVGYMWAQASGRAESRICGRGTRRYTAAGGLVGAQFVGAQPQLHIRIFPLRTLDTGAADASAFGSAFLLIWVDFPPGA